MGAIEMQYKNKRRPENVEEYIDSYNQTVLRIKPKLKEASDLAATALPRKENVLCGGLYHVGWYITDTFIPDYIDGYDDGADRNWIFLVPEKYSDEPVLVCTFKDKGPERAFRELFEVNLEPIKLGDPPPGLNLEQLIKIEAGLKEFQLKMFL